MKNALFPKAFARLTVADCIDRREFVHFSCALPAEQEDQQYYGDTAKNTYNNAVVISKHHVLTYTVDEHFSERYAAYISDACAHNRYPEIFYDIQGTY